MPDCIDLTLSDDDAPLPVSKRARRTPDSDDGVQLVPRSHAAPSGTMHEQVDEDLVVTNITGKVATRDYPHARHVCATHSFSKEASAGNAAYCQQCYCHVCDVLASGCEFWGTGVQPRDHCNAHDRHSYWDALRKAAKKRSNRVLLATEHSSTDPSLTVSWETSSSKSSLRGITSPVQLWQRANLLPGHTNSSSKTKGNHTSIAASASNLLANARAAAAGHEAPAAHKATPSAATPAAACPAADRPAAGTPASTTSVTINPAPAGAAAAAAGADSSKPKVRAKPDYSQGPPLHTASRWLKRMPHPSTSKSPMQLLAKLELPVKAAKGLTIQELSQRLVPTGFYKPEHSKQRQRMTADFGECLCLDNINNTNFVLEKRKEKAAFCRLLPLAPPSGLPKEPSTQRTWRFVVLQHESSSKPLAVAVTVKQNCKLSGLITAIRQQLAAQGSSCDGDELLLGSYSEAMNSWRWLKNTHLAVQDDVLNAASYVHYCLRVPKELVPTPTNAMVKEAKFAVIIHEKLVAPGGGEEDEEVDMLRCLGVIGERKGKVVKFGVPQLVLIPQQHSMGGHNADKYVSKAVADQLGLYCQSAPPPSHRSWPFTLYRYSHQDSWQRDDTNRLSNNGYHLPMGWDSPGVATLYAYWGSEPLLPPPGFSLDSFKLPEVPDDADKQRLADMPDVLKRHAEWQADIKLLQMLPGLVLYELKQQCAAQLPEQDQSPATMSKPAAAAVLSLRPVTTTDNSCSSSSGGGGDSHHSGGSSSSTATVAEATALSCGGKRAQEAGRLGVLTVEVYVYKTAGPHHRMVTQDHSTWEGGTVVYGRNSVRTGMESCLLRQTMHARLLQEESGYRLVQELVDLKSVEDSVRGITKLMDWLKTAERTPAEQPPGLTVQLHPYQLQSLAFMQEAEAAAGGWRSLLWKWLPHTPASSSSSSNTAGGSSTSAAAEQQLQSALTVDNAPGVWYSPILDRMSFDVPAAPWGGFLAEEMGLGKTVEVLGLVLSNPAPATIVSGMKDISSKKVLSRATLVVCAVSLVGQWCSEAAKKLNGSLRMYAYHGSNRIRDPMKLACDYDLVVTTYATLASDYGKNGSGTNNPLHKIKWHRVVFDEGHTVKNVQATHSKACVAVEADRRWCCTGTPINNDITDLLGQFAAIRLQPFGSKAFFDGQVRPAFTGHGYGVSLMPLLYTLRHTLIRHTKAQTISGVSVLALPDKTEELVPVGLAPAERRAYLEVHEKAAALWASARGFAPAAINQRLLQIMALLLPLRRICSGGQLRPADLALPVVLEAAVNDAEHSHFATGGLAAAGNTGNAAAAVAAAAAAFSVAEDVTISPPSDLECPICLDAFECPVMTICKHWFCKECILGVLTANTHCPLCRSIVDKLQLRAPGKNKEPTPVVTKKRRRRRPSGADSSEEEEEMIVSAEPESDSEDAAAAARGSEGGQVINCESKLQALVKELRAMRAADPSSKALVFSQFNSTLEWLKRRLPEEGFGFRTITGSMPQRQRAKAIEAFQGDPPTTVFLLSMRSGAVGINLTAADHVFLLEPCLNPALEEQAIGRAWRMGQQRRVVVKRFYVKGSVEERIMDVRKARQGPTATPGSDTAAAAAAAMREGSSLTAAGDDDDPRTGKVKRKVGAGGMVGSLKTDRQVLKIAEFDLLFKTPTLDGDEGAGSSAAAEHAAADRAGV